MPLTFAIVGAVIWFILILALWFFKQRPEAQLRKRLNQMIDQAEEERGRTLKHKSNSKTPVVSVDGDELATTRQRVPFYGRVVVPLLNVLDNSMQKFAPATIRAQLEDKIFRAGKIGMSIGIFTLGSIFLAQQNAAINSVQRILVIFIGVLIGAGVPFAVLNTKIRQRKKAIRRQLPEFMDLLCVSVQAGLSFDGAVAKMIRRMKGPLIDEFRRMLNDVSLGMTHQYALTAMAKRCDLEEIYLFTTSIIQAEKLGTSMTRTLKVQADNMRDRHRQWVKSEALKAPVKILFPMILFIFPSMFIVLLYPAIFTLIKNLGTK